MKNAAAIIPAYNEEKYIGDVLSVLLPVEYLSEIIVVNDGSTDRTSEIARSFGVTVIDLPSNQGKGTAMRQGLLHTEASVILFLDADLIGLTSLQVCDLLHPVMQNYADMTLGLFHSGRAVTDIAQKITPFLTGQRAVKRWVLDALTEEDWLSGFGIEVTLTRIAKNLNIRMLEIPLINVTHAMKEEKMGIVRGVAARAKMYWEIAKKWHHT